MAGDERLSTIRTLIFDYVRSPSLRHIRDAHAVDKLAQGILRATDRGTGPWSKWDAIREAQLTAAATTWIPIEDLTVYLNSIPGPALTQTDVSQRLWVIQEEGIGLYPDDRLRDSCLSLYRSECVAGTEMAAIISALQQHAEEQSERLRREQEDRYRKLQLEKKEALQARLLSGADCKWATLLGHTDFFCRTNGRLYRLSRGKDKRWSLFRVETIDDQARDPIGQYSGRGDATKVVSRMAFEPELKRR